MPLIAGKFRILTGPENTGIGGSSYGGVAALTCVFRRPGTFGMLLLESTPLFLFDRRLLEEARSLPAFPSAVYVGIGTRETGDEAVLRASAGVQEAFVDIVHQRSPGTRVLLNVVEGATHSSAAWRARMPTALAFLLRNLRLRNPSGT
jgi:predicted alpha/beta superfamily hydrolase